MQIIHHINSTFILFLLFLNCIIKYNILLGGNDMSDYIFCESKAYLRFLEEWLGTSTPFSHQKRVSTALK